MQEGHRGRLVVTRNLNKRSIMIGDDIEVTILSISGNEVEISIEADKNIPVHRREVYERIKRQEN